jgi:hypothetical protein
MNLVFESLNLRSCFDLGIGKKIIYWGVRNRGPIIEISIVNSFCPSSFRSLLRLSSCLILWRFVLGFISFEFNSPDTFDVRNYGVDSYSVTSLELEPKFQGRTNFLQPGHKNSLHPYISQSF